MPYQVVNLPRLVAQSTGTGSVTQGIGNLDDANAINIFITSSAGIAHTALVVSVSQFDPAIAAPSGVTQSTGWNQLSTALYGFTSSGQAIIVSPVAFRGLRLGGTSSAATGEVVAYASKQILV